MGEDGTLKILHDGEKPIILNTNTVPSSIARLENFENFKVAKLNANRTRWRILWQSFDYPTNTLFPSMKLGMKFNTK